IIIKTSHLGSSLIREKFEKLNESNREEIVESAKNEVLEMLKQTIRPEFLNRIDEIIMFTPLNEKEIQEIVHIQIKGIQKMLEQNGVKLELTDDAIALLAEKGYDPQFGARPVKRVIQKMLLNELSKSLIAQTIDREKPIVVKAEGENLVFKN
ncbi:MAG: AAA family ATPase, partial [Paludibacteraceae bacterium]|nr:AAA family ATPase [Paludibacteraceae bacterium]